MYTHKASYLRNGACDRHQFWSFLKTAIAIPSFTKTGHKYFKRTHVLFVLVGVELVNVDYTRYKRHNLPDHEQLRLDIPLTNLPILIPYYVNNWFKL